MKRHSGSWNIPVPSWSPPPFPSSVLLQCLPPDQSCSNTHDHDEEDGGDYIDRDETSANIRLGFNCCHCEVKSSESVNIYYWSRYKRQFISWDTKSLHIFETINTGLISTEGGQGSHVPTCACLHWDKGVQTVFCNRNWSQWLRMREIIPDLLTIMFLRVLVTRKTEVIDEKINISVHCGVHEKVKFTNEVWLKNWIQRR